MVARPLVVFEKRDFHVPSSSLLTSPKDLWGPLIFCLLLSMFLSIRASKDQTDLVFSGVFSIVWLGEAVVTLQIKLLGGNMYVSAYKLRDQF